jgi:hypothetical protein
VAEFLSQSRRKDYCEVEKAKEVRKGEKPFKFLQNLLNFFDLFSFVVKKFEGYVFGGWRKPRPFKPAVRGGTGDKGARHKDGCLPSLFWK